MARSDDQWSDDRPDGVSTLRHYLLALLRRKWVLLTPIVLFPIVALAASLQQESRYEASADVLVNRQEVATTTLIGETPALDDPFRSMQTQVRLARVPSVLERTVAAADPPRLSPKELRAQSRVSPIADLLRFAVSDRDRGRAAQLAAAYARAFVRFKRELDTLGLASTLSELRGQLEKLEAQGRVNSPLYVRFADRAQQLESLRALRASNVSVVRSDEAQDADQVAPRPKRNTALALAGGLVVGLVLVFLWESLSTKPRSREEFEALLGMQLLGELDRPGAEPAAVDEATGSRAEAVHLIRANLELANAVVGARTVMITSSHAGEGKSEAAAELAFALARAGRHVILVDLDLRQRYLTRFFGLEDTVGVTSVLSGTTDVEEALMWTSLDQVAAESGATAPADSGPTAPLLEVLGAGPGPGHPVELLSSKSLSSIMRELAQRAELVVVDVPPLLDKPDAAAVASAIDGLLLVVSSRRARGPSLAEARRSIERLPLARMGFVLTHAVGGRPTLGALRTPATAARRSVVEAQRVT